MQYQINQTIISLSEGHIECSDKNISINDKTELAMALFLNSENAIISKDHLLESVWMGVIVSDASIFKQVQILRSLFIEIGLPEDTIENVYGKGYRLKYAVEQVTEDKSDNQAPASTVNKDTKKNNRPMLYGIISVVLITAVSLYFWFNQQQPFDKLKKEQKTSIIKLSKNNWQDGLDNINNLLANPQTTYSTADLAFLYHQKGQAEQNLQLIDESLVSLNQSLDYYQLQNDQDGMGDAHLLLARLYDYIDNPEKQLNHIKTATDLFKAVGNHSAEIDAYLELAYLEKKSGKMDASIKTYETAIERAKAVEDKTGEMIAINNLAATYLIINNTEKATELAEQGLAINLTLDNGQNIANSYSFLSQLALQNGDTSKAFKMIEQALKYQLQTESHKNLSPKLMGLNYLLLETHQYQVTNEILSLTDAYAKSLNIKGGSAIIDLYQGMLLAYQNDWQGAQTELASAWETATKKNFNYKKPLTMSFLAVSYAQTANHLKSIELANQVLAEKRKSPREAQLAHLALAISFTALENNELSQKWSSLVAENSRIDWPVEHLIWLRFKLSTLSNSEIIARNQLQQQIAETESYITALAQNNQIDSNLLEQIKTQVSQLIAQKNESLG